MESNNPLLGWVRDIPMNNNSQLAVEGEMLNSPALRLMDIFPILVEDRQVNVDTSKPIAWLQFDPAQMTYAQLHASTLWTCFGTVEWYNR